MSSQYYNNLYINIESIYENINKKHIYILHICSKLQDDNKYIYNCVSNTRLMETTSKNKSNDFIETILTPTTEFSMLITKITELINKSNFDTHVKYVKIKIWKSNKKKKTFLCKKTAGSMSKILSYIQNIFSNETKKKKRFQI